MDPTGEKRPNVVIDLSFPNAEILVVTQDPKGAVRLVDAGEADNSTPVSGSLCLHVSRESDGSLRLRGIYDLQQPQQQQQQQQQQQPPLPEPKDALSELIVTEAVYVRRLSLLFGHVYLGLHSAALKRRFSCCTCDELKSVFGHYESMKMMHEQLLNELKESQASGDGSRDSWRIGVLMTRYGHLLKSYSSYYSSFRMHIATVTTWMKDDAFRSVYRQLMFDWHDKTDTMLDVTSHMLEPIQRPLRYPMLLSHYIKEIGPEHPDAADAEKALKVVQETTNNFEKKVKDFNDFQERLMVLRNVNFPNNLTSYWEKLVLDCPLHCQARNVTNGKDCYLLLCSSALLVCKPVRFKSTNWMASTAIELTKDARIEVDGRSLRVTANRRTMEFALPTDAEGRAWSAEIRRIQVSRSDSGVGDLELLPWETKFPNRQQHHRTNKCEGCGSGFSAIAQVMSRKACSICSGYFCSNCLAYTQQQKRCCLYCKAMDDDAAVTNPRHRELIQLYRSARLADNNGAAGQLLVKIEKGDWNSLWCRASEGCLLLYQRKRQFLHSDSLKSPKLLAESEANEEEKGERDEDEEANRSESVDVIDAGGRKFRLKGDPETLQSLLTSLERQLRPDSGMADTVEGDANAEVKIRTIANAKAMKAAAMAKSKPKPKLKYDVDDSEDSVYDTLNNAVTGAEVSIDNEGDTESDYDTLTNAMSSETSAEGNDSTRDADESGAQSVSESDGTEGTVEDANSEEETWENSEL